jgi:lysophospholipid acyltransferase (LPLAT)-like uncharacterized protein
VVSIVNRKSKIVNLFIREFPLSWLDRLKISFISNLGYWVIRLICATLRWESRESQSLDSIRATGKRLIVTFWHGRIFMTTYHFRNQGIVAMTSQNRDGEYIARVLHRFGCRAARGSSSRGSHGATVECLRAMKDGRDLGIAIDGPRGPRYVAKPGAAYLAGKSGNPVVPFNISVERKWVMRSWDHFEVPLPFSRAVVLIGNPIYVDANATGEQAEAAETQIQRSLDELRARGDSWWGNPIVVKR